MQTSGLAKLPFIKSQQDKIHWGNLSGSALSLAICEAIESHQGPSILVVPDTPTALRLEHELEFFRQPQQYDVFVFPDWETLPYDGFSPHQDIISQRILTLYKLPHMQSGVVIVPIATLMHRVAPKQFLQANSLIVNSGQQLDVFALRNDLESAGYLAVDQVMAHGEFSLRGSIFDVYPMGSTRPYRIDLFDDEVDSIRYFDTETQRSGDKVEKIELLPAHEFPTDDKAIERFRTSFRQHFEIKNDKDSIYQQVSKKVLPGGIEYYMALCFRAAREFIRLLT